MSATLGSLLTELEPDWTVSLFERLDAAAAESSDPWNNAGTGHSALCELNYTPQNADGSVSIDKAIDINERFQVSRQYWAYAVEKGILGNPSRFINTVPHISFVHGEDNVKYLRKRYDALAGETLFEGIQYTQDRSTFSEWLPLMARKRDFSDPIALNRFDLGTDVDFGALTRQLLTHLGASGYDVRFGHEVTNITKQSDGRWKLKVRNVRTGAKRTVIARFVFVGAGGGALPLLQKSGIKEIKGFGGFPISGQFLRCTNPDLIKQHEAKVYGKAAVGAPPMSVPHLDTRVIAGERGLLFGPYAGWTPKFLKEGHLTDLFLSVKPGNIFQMMSVGIHEMGLTKYLIEQVVQSEQTRIDALSEFIPDAVGKDWDLITAGQRVQTIRTGKDTKGTLEFGTAIVAAEDGSIAGLLGASPGASTCVSAMLEVLERCFTTRYKTWEKDLQRMIPSVGRQLNTEPALYQELWDWTNNVLKLVPEPEPATASAPSDTAPAGAPVEASSTVAGDPADEADQGGDATERTAGEAPSES